MEICCALWFLKLSGLKNSFGNLMTTAALLKCNESMLIVLLISDQFPGRNNLKEAVLFLAHGLRRNGPS